MLGICMKLMIIFHTSVRPELTGCDEKKHVEMPMMGHVIFSRKRGAFTLLTLKELKAPRSEYTIC